MAAEGIQHPGILYRADSRFAPSQWETALLCNDVSHWLGTNLESALMQVISNTFISPNNGLATSRWQVIVMSDYDIIEKLGGWEKEFPSFLLPAESGNRAHSSHSWVQRIPTGNIFRLHKKLQKSKYNHLRFWTRVPIAYKIWGSSIDNFYNYSLWFLWPCSSSCSRFPWWGASWQLWHHNERDGVSNHWRLYCLLNRLFRRRSKKYQSSASLAFVRGIHRWPVNFPHKGPVTRKIFPFDDVVMQSIQRMKPNITLFPI